MPEIAVCGQCGQAESADMEADSTRRVEHTSPYPHFFEYPFDWTAQAEDAARVHTH